MKDRWFYDLKRLGSLGLEMPLGLREAKDFVRDEEDR